MKRKFDAYYVLAKEGLSFAKYPRLLELEAHHGVKYYWKYDHYSVNMDLLHFHYKCC